MQTLVISTEEADILREMLRQNVREIDMELFHTDAHNFKEMLKRRKVVLEQVLTKLSGEPTIVAA